MEINKHEFMKAFATSLAKMVEANPINVLVLDELITLGAILTSELYEQDLGGKKNDNIREIRRFRGNSRKHSK